jgi:acyl-coenzyme A synthetase/AMP-(fatty) acid ligase
MPMNVAGRILHFGKTRSFAAALVEGERTITYGELAAMVRRTAVHLAALGLQRGERVGLCLKDSSTHLIALLAVALRGAVAVPLDWRARPTENARFIDALGLARVLAEPDAQVADEPLTIRVDDEWRRDVSRVEANGEWAADWSDPFVISATSGSTGASKFTLMTHLQYHFAITGMLELMALAGRHRFLCTLPLYYSGGRNSCIAHLLRGDCVVLYPSLFRPAEYIELANRERITVGALVPSVVRQLLACGGQAPLLPGMAALFCAGAPLFAEEKRQAARTLTRHFQERYGTAETLAISILRPEDFANRAESVGQPHSLVEIGIVDDHDRPLASDDVGRMRVRGPGVGSALTGLGQPADFRGGWYYPGEIARVDSEGYLFLHGRVSEVIMRGGAKVYPTEIERILLEHPQVLEAAVLGYRGPDNEETVIAFVVPRADMPAGELVSHCRVRLTPHKVPRQIHFCSQMPRNAAGKVDKLALAQRLTAASNSTRYD